MQHALCLYSMGQYAHAVSVLKEVSRLPPIKVMTCLLAAQTCCTHLNQIGEGLDRSSQTMNHESSNPQCLLPTCHLYLGIGFNLQADEKQS